MGITDYAQSKLGDIVVIDLPKPGDRVEQMKSAAVIESFKAVSEIYSPVTGTVVEVNSSLKEDPGLVNRDPYGAGWIFKAKPDSIDRDRGQLLDAPDYQNFVGGQG